MVVLSRPTTCLRLALMEAELQKCCVLLRTYSDPERAMRKMNRLSCERLFLITVERRGGSTVSHCSSYKLPKIDGTYLIDEESETNNDIGTVFNDLKEKLLATGCCNSISSSVASLQSEKNALPTRTYHPDSVGKEERTFLWKQILARVILNLPRPSQTEINQALSRLVQRYSGDVTAKRQLMGFQQNYDRRDAIHWYTSSTCIYPLMNAAFRISSIDDIFGLRFFIYDLYLDLAALHEEQSRDALRGKTVSRYMKSPGGISLSDFKKAIGGFVSTNCFLSASTVPDNLDTGDNNDILMEIISTDCAEDTAVPFAFVSECSSPDDQREVLFSWHTPFLYKTFRHQ